MEDVHLSGSLKDMNYEDFMEIYNMSTKEFRDKFQEPILQWVFLENKPKVLDGEEKLSTSELQSRIWALEKFKDAFLVHITKSKVVLADELENTSEDEREYIAKRDKDYDAKRAKKLNAEPKKEEKVTERAEKRIIDGFVQLGMTQKEAEAKFIEMRSSRLKSKERQEPLTGDDKLIANLVKLGMTQDEARVHLISKRAKK